MKKIWVLATLVVFLSCGTYQYNTHGVKVKHILAITETGDTVSVPYRNFLKERYYYYPRFEWNNSWYWNNWRNNYNTDWWWVEQQYYNWNSIPTYVPRSTSPRSNPKPRPRPRPEPQPRPRQDFEQERVTPRPPRVQSTPNVVRQSPPSKGRRNNQ